MKTVEEILDTAVKSAKIKLKDKFKGRDKYLKRMKNRQKLKNKR